MLQKYFYKLVSVLYSYNSALTYFLSLYEKNETFLTARLIITDRVLIAWYEFAIDMVSQAEYLLRMLETL